MSSDHDDERGKWASRLEAMTTLRIVSDEELQKLIDQGELEVNPADLFQISTESMAQYQQRQQEKLLPTGEELMSTQDVLDAYPGLTDRHLMGIPEKSLPRYREGGELKYRRSEVAFVDELLRRLASAKDVPGAIGVPSTPPAAAATTTSPPDDFMRKSEAGKRIATAKAEAIAEATKIAQDTAKKAVDDATKDVVRTGEVAKAIGDRPTTDEVRKLVDAGSASFDKKLDALKAEATSAATAEAAKATTAVKTAVADATRDVVRKTELATVLATAKKEAASVASDEAKKVAEASVKTAVADATKDVVRTGEIDKVVKPAVDHARDELKKIVDTTAAAAAEKAVVDKTGGISKKYVDDEVAKVASKSGRGFPALVGWLMAALLVIVFLLVLVLLIRGLFAPASNGVSREELDKVAAAMISPLEQRIMQLEQEVKDRQTAWNKRQDEMLRKLDRENATLEGDFKALEKKGGSDEAPARPEPRAAAQGEVADEYARQQLDGVARTVNRHDAWIEEKDRDSESDFDSEWRERFDLLEGAVSCKHWGPAETHLRELRRRFSGDDAQFVKTLRTRGASRAVLEFVRKHYGP